MGRKWIRDLDLETLTLSHDVALLTGCFVYVDSKVRNRSVCLLLLFTFAWSRSQMLCPCVRELRNIWLNSVMEDSKNISTLHTNAVYRYRCHYSLPASLNFTVLLSSTDIRFVAYSLPESMWMHHHTPTPTASYGTVAWCFIRHIVHQSHHFNKPGDIGT